MAVNATQKPLLSRRRAWPPSNSKLTHVGRRRRAAVDRKNMRAMVLEALQRPLVLRDRPAPVPGVDQVLIEVEACGVCRTDLHILDGELTPAHLPLILGHEIIGRVVGTGASVRHVQPGMRVGVPWLGWADQ